MAALVEWFCRKVIGRHYFSADKTFEGESGEHVEAETANFDS
jgi:hypothetical protein